MSEHPTAAPPPEDREQLLQRLQTAERDRDAARKRSRRLAAALALSLMALVAVIGAGAWFLHQRHLAEQAREAELRRAIEDALRKADELLQKADWGAAREAVDRAEALLGDSGPEELRKRVGKVRADLEMIRRLEEVRLRGALDQGGAEGSTARAYRQAFKEFGLDP